MPKKLTKKEYKNRRRAKQKIERRKRTKPVSMERTLSYQNNLLLDELLNELS